MDTRIPAAADVRRRLEALTYSQVQELARASGVPFTTLWKVRDGTTGNPGIETVGKFWPELIGATGSPPAPTEREAA
ncbi:MAG: hypothetical protein KIH64_014975 [Mycobacterium sp.]|nr:hypothetical protein [Mycobacterium sp.]